MLTSKMATYFLSIEESIKSMLHIKVVTDIHILINSSISTTWQHPGKQEMFSS